MELPYILVQSVIYSAIVYSMIGFEWTAAKCVFKPFACSCHDLRLFFALTRHQPAAIYSQSLGLNDLRT